MQALWKALYKNALYVCGSNTHEHWLQNMGLGWDSSHQMSPGETAKRVF